MSRLVYNMNHDVKGTVYARLLNYALNYCDSFILVIRESFDVGPFRRGGDQEA
jgi:hypothetical protein